MPVQWKPKSDRIAQLIQQEEERLNLLRERRPFMPEETTPTFTMPEAEAPVWQPERAATPTQTLQAPPEVEREVTNFLWSPGTITEPETAAPSVPQGIKQYEWWEQPKAMTEQAMETVGRGMSKVPLLPEALGFVAPAFEFIHEKLEKPWASIITAPFSPSLSWNAGESWMEHEKREYESWKSPTYVKGLAEFAMPLWWMPWLGWAGKGAKALGVGDKMAQALSKLPMKPLALPTKEVLNSTLYKQDFFKRMALWSENKPVLNAVVRAVGGPSAFVRDVGEVYPAIDTATRRLVAVSAKNVPVATTDVVKREIVNRAVLYDMRHGYRGLQLPRMQKFGNPVDVLQVDDFGRAMAAIPKSFNKLGNGLSDVFEHPAAYTYASQNAENIVKEGNRIIKELFDLAGKEGVQVPKQTMFHRLVEGKEITVGDKTVYEASEYGSRFEAQRHYKTMQEGIEAGVRYNKDPLRSIGATIDYHFKKIADQRFNNEVKKLGMTVPEMVSLIEPTLIERMVETGTRVGSASYLVQTLKTLKSYSGKSIPSAVKAKIKRGLPEQIERIEQAFAISPQDASVLMTALAQTIRAETKINARSLKILMGQFIKAPDETSIMNLLHKGNYEEALGFFTRAGASKEQIIRFTNLLYKGDYTSALRGYKKLATRIRASDIEDMVQSLNLTNATTNKAIRQAYQAVYQSRKDFIDDTLNAVRLETDELLKAGKTELKGLKGQYNLLARPYMEPGKQIFGGLAKFRMHPAFRNRIFDKEVVDIAEKALGDRGNQWLKNMANISGTGRLLIAAMDFSAPFIQGLAVLGRNPLAWSKGVVRQFEFFAKPQNLMKYMDDPSVRAIASERWFYGGSRSSFEFFEALKPVQELVGKVPVAGRVGQRAIAQTYGRAEAAFTGFGEVARNEMWKALRHKAVKEGALDDNLARELARTVDRMTGVMSMEALAIGRVQTDFENAFLFFAPRYTRAGMSFVTDVFKGGMTGAEARKALGSMMASGMAMYYGICTTLGQKPNLDINSARFMTVKIGDSHVGIGGIFYSLGRLAANVAGTAMEEPADFLSMSRFDNPFIKFMFSRSAPLTGFTVGAVVERKNFFGEPLESIGDWGKFMAEKALPIAMQRAILEPEHRQPAVFISELMGGRTFPKSAWELQEETKESISQSEHGMSYDELDILEKKRIDNYPEVIRFQEEIDKQTTQRGKALSVAFLERGREVEDARFMHRQQVEQSQRAFDAGLITGYDFKESVTEINYGYAATIEHINSNPRYADVLKKLDEPREVSSQYRWELAYGELMEAVAGNRFEDKYGIFDFDGYNDFLESLKAKYGDADYNRAIEAREERFDGYPPLYFELQQAKEILKPYWEVTDRVVKLFGKQFAETPAGQSLVSKLRKAKRLADPKMEAAYQRFYAQ